MKYLKSENGIVEFDYELSPEMYSIGATYADYVSGYWIPLTSQQEHFLAENQGASAREIIEMKMIVHTTTLDEEQLRLVEEIKRYDTSHDVNQFYITGTPMWLDKEMRVGLMNSINIERSAGRTETNLWFNGIRFTFQIEQAINMLNLLELYSLDCYNVTQQHIAAVNALTSKEEVQDYNFKTGYPDKLNF